MESGRANKARSPYIVLIMDWHATGSHWIKGFASLEEARLAANEKAAKHQTIMDRIVIIKGEILQLGNHG